MTIMLKEILPIQNLVDYKIHFAKFNQINEPLDVLVRDSGEWKAWQAYRPTKDDFNRPFIFSLANFYHELNTWMFGGVYKVLSREPDRYEVELIDLGKHFINRLKLRSTYNERNTRVKMENHFDAFEVVEILREPYSGRPFPGYENIDLSFEELSGLMAHDRTDWKVSLKSIKGVYLIRDVSTGRGYVGSAYGTDGVWGRWCSYIQNGHGGNLKLQDLVSSHGIDYCKKNYRFALLEQRPFAASDSFIIEREEFWKKLLSTRGDQGLN